MLRPFLIFLIALIVGFEANAQNLRLAPTAGQRVEQDLAIGQKCVISIPIRANQYVRFAVTERRYLDVELRLTDPNGKLLLVTGGADGIVTDEIPLADPPTVHGFFGRQYLEWVADQAGTYELEISALQSSVDGAFELTVEELRTGSYEDRQRVQAFKLVHESERLMRDAGDPERFKTAMKLKGEALTILRSIGDKSGEAEVLNSIGICYWKLGDAMIPQAEVHFEEARKVWHGLSNKQGEAIATFNYLSMLYSSRNLLATSNEARDTKSTRPIEEFLEKWEGVVDPRLRAYVLTSTAIWSMHQRKSDDAFRLAEKALKGWRELDDFYGQTLVFYEMGNHYVWLKEFAKAESCYAEAAKYANAGGFRYREAAVRLDWGEVLYNHGEYRMAFDLYEKALSLARGSGRSIEGYCYFNLGVVSYALGELDESLDYHNKALPLWFGNINGIAYTLNAIGKIYNSRGRPKEALAYYERALLPMRESRDTYGEAYLLGDIGAGYANLGKYELALEYYNQSLQKSTKSLDPRSRGRTRNNIGALYEKTGELEKAFDNYSLALESFRSVGNRVGEANTLYLISSMEMLRGDLTRALALSQDALRIVESLRGNVPRLELRTSYLSSVQQYYELNVNVLMALHRKRPGEGFDILAMNANEQSRARSLLEVLSETKAKLTQSVDSGLIEREKSIQRRLNDKAERLARMDATANKQERAALDSEIDNLTIDLQQAQDEIRISNPRYMEFVQPAKFDVRQFQAQELDGDTLLLEYALGEDASHLWLVSKDSISSFQLPRRAEIEALSRSFYESLTAIAPLANETPAAYSKRVRVAAGKIEGLNRRLSRILLGPVAERLGNKRLVIVADGAVQYIPFSALKAPNLPEQDSGPLLIANHEIVYLPSATTVNALRRNGAERTEPDLSVAVIADPVFELNDSRFSGGMRARHNPNSKRSRPNELLLALRDTGIATRDGLTISRLPATRSEANAVMANAPAGRSLKAVDFDANYSNATSDELRRYRIVHFATHGILDNRHPELSGLVLSLFNKQGESQRGFLRLNEIYNMRLSADLVVLSACRTGLGKDMRGEGLIGLTRGFMYAGARSVVASLWKVDDEATAELMRLFYQYMFKENAHPADALRRAQFEISKQKRWRDPYYWSGFILQGEWK